MREIKEFTPEAPPDNFYRKHNEVATALFCHFYIGQFRRLVFFQITQTSLIHTKKASRKQLARKEEEEVIQSRHHTSSAPH